MARHPFDARRSGRDPFPDFAATMRQLGDSDDESDAQFSHANGSDFDWASQSQSNSDSDTDRGGDAGGCQCAEACDGACGEATPVTLRWSIDALATLLPQEFSPLPHQKRPPTATPSRALALYTHRTPDQIQTQTHRRRRRRRWSEGSSSSERRAWTPPSTGGRTPGFFEDETQYQVLRTPAAVIEREQMQMQMPQQQQHTGAAAYAEYTRWRAPEATRWRELHRRCVETMQLCEERLRERQHKLRRLPIPASKLKIRRRSTASSHSSGSGGSTKTPISRAEESMMMKTPVRSTAIETPTRDPLTPVMATRLSFGSIDLSPIPVCTAEKKRAQTIELHDHSASLPVTPAAASNRKPPAFGPGTNFLSPTPSLSSIAEHPNDVLTPSFASLRFAASDYEDEAEKDNKENDQPSSSSSGDVSASSLRTMSLVRAEGDSSCSTSSSPFTPPSADQDAHRSTVLEDRRRTEEEKENEAIAKRQLSFMAAIEEEAQARDASRASQKSRRDQISESATEESESDVATDDGAGQRRVAGQSRLLDRQLALQQHEQRLAVPPATSMASIYKEARALGITEPTAQWEYVQLISKQTVSRRRPV